MKNKVRFTLC